MRWCVVLVLALCATVYGEEKTAAPEMVWEKLATDYRFTEGPTVDKDGNVYFNDIPNEEILFHDCKTGETKRFRDGSGGANGMMFDPKGRLIACLGRGRRVVHMEKDKMTVLAIRYGDNKLNSPNDVTIDKDGGLYFTDPRYGKQEGRELDFEGVFYVPPGSKQLKRICTAVVKPNGIHLAKDEKVLYVADSRRKLIMAYDVTSPGVVANPRVFANLDLKSRGGPDGMTLDAEGNLYVAGQGRIWVFDKAGKQLRTHEVPEKPTNCVFAGPKRDTLYVTARTSFYRYVPKDQVRPKKSEEDEGE